MPPLTLSDHNFMGRPSAGSICHILYKEYIAKLAFRLIFSVKNNYYKI